jgi:hypothetical protein
VTSEDFLAVLNRIQFRDWTLRSGDLSDGRYIQWLFPAPCHQTREPSIQHGRKWPISQHAIADEVVKTAWLAVEVALRHEALEDFTVDGVSPFHPHTDFEKLLGLQHLPGIHVRRAPQTAQ